MNKIFGFQSYDIDSTIQGPVSIISGVPLNFMKACIHLFLKKGADFLAIHIIDPDRDRTAVWELEYYCGLHVERIGIVLTEIEISWELVIRAEKQILCPIVRMPGESNFCFSENCSVAFVKYDLKTISNFPLGGEGTALNDPVGVC